MDWKLKLTAFLTVILMLAVAATPVVEASVEEEAVEEEPMMVADEEYGTVLLAIAAIGLICTVTSLVSGIVIGMNLADDKSDDDGAGDQEKIYQAQRKAYADNIAYTSDVVTNLISSVLPQDADLWFFTTDAWQDRKSVV